MEQSQLCKSHGDITDWSLAIKIILTKNAESEIIIKQGNYFSYE